MSIARQCVFLSMSCRIKGRIFLKNWILFIAFSSNLALAQIQTGDKSAGEDKPEKVPSTFNEDSLKGINYYYSGLVMWTYRAFEDQSVYGSYQKRYDEGPSWRGGMTLGVSFPMAKKVSLDIGVTYFGTGEKYTYEDSLNDSSFSYLRRYLHFGVPLKVRLTFGKKAQFFTYVGITPMNIVQMRYDEVYTDSIGSIFDAEELKIKDGFAGFHLMGSVGVGVQYNFRYLGYFYSVEYRQHFMNSYDKNLVPLKHRQFAFGMNFGAYLRF